MRFLGIDYGTVKVGLALSDESAKFAFPNAVLKNDKNLLRIISEICENSDVSKIVLGWPGRFKGNTPSLLNKIRKFKAGLENYLKLPVVFESEILTTKQAERLQGKTRKIDASAAAIILQSYLDRENLL